MLTFSDEFDGGSLDKSKWSNGFGWGQGTNSDYGWCDPANNVVSGGVLAQRIERRPKGGQPFSVGCIHSKNKFAQEYGYWEARIRAARCFGARTAFWGKPNDESWPPEIDVVEVNGDGPDRAAGPSSPPTGAKAVATSRARASTPGPTSPRTSTSSAPSGAPRV